jgi:single-strand DNA-binding protein
VAPARPVVAGTGARLANTGGVNSVSLIGRLAEPPELRISDDGAEICAMRLAVPRVARGGMREPGVVYVEVTTSGWQAREIHDALLVGARIGVAGRIELDEWITPEGERVSRHEVMADQLELLDPPPERRAPEAAA